MTRQMKDKMSFRRRKRTIEGFPLKAFIEQRGLRFYRLITSCHRGYTATWTLSNGRLYLTGLSGMVKSEQDRSRSYRHVGMDLLFPDQQKVFAEWYTGILCWHAGPSIYQDQLMDLYLHDFYVKIELGKVVATKVLNKAYLYFADEDVETKLFAGQLDMSPSAMAIREKNFEHLQRKGCRYLFELE